MRLSVSRVTVILVVHPVICDVAQFHDLATRHTAVPRKSSATDGNNFFSAKQVTLISIVIQD